MTTRPDLLLLALSAGAAFVTGLAYVTQEATAMARPTLVAQPCLHDVPLRKALSPDEVGRLCSRGHPKPIRTTQE